MQLSAPAFFSSETIWSIPLKRRMYACREMRPCRPQTVWSWFTAHRSCTSLYNEPTVTDISISSMRQLADHSCGTRRNHPTGNIKSNLLRQKTDRNFKSLEENFARPERTEDEEKVFPPPSLSSLLLSVFLSPYGSHLSGGGLSDINNRLWKNRRREGGRLLSSWGTGSLEAWCPSWQKRGESETEGKKGKL